MEEVTEHQADAEEQGNSEDFTDRTILAGHQITKETQSVNCNNGQCKCHRVDMTYPEDINNNVLKADKRKKENKNIQHCGWI